MDPKPSADAPQDREGWVLPEALEELVRGGNADLIPEIFSEFRTDVGSRLARLREAVARNDGATLRDEVHSIKGSAAQMGATDLAVACLQLESEGPAREWRLTCSDIDNLQALFDQVLRAMARHPLAGTGTSGAAERT